MAHWQRSQRPPKTDSELDETAETVTVTTETVTAMDVLAWLPTASLEDKRKVAVWLARDTAGIKKIMPAKTIPPKATPENIFKTALGLLSPEDTPAVH